MAHIQHQLPDDYLIRRMRESDRAEIAAICAKVYPTERPYTDEELHAHHELFPEGQYGLGRALTKATRALVREKGLWPMVGGSRMPGYGCLAATVEPDEYITRVKRAELSDPVLTAHLHDGWDAITAIRGYLPHDDESAGWAAVIQWLNPDSPPPPEFDLSRIPRNG